MSAVLRPIVIACLATASIVGAASRVEADVPVPRTSSLSWARLSGAEACIDVRALAQSVERRLGRAAFVPPTRGDVAIDARIERLQNREAWRATISVFDATGARIGLRELESANADCHAIDDELELVIALLIDPSAPLAPSASPSPPPVALPVTPPSTTRPAFASPPPCPPSPAAPPPDPWRVGVTVGALAEAGLLPRLFGVGVAIRAHVAPPRGPSYELGGALFGDDTVTIPSGDRTFSLAFGWLSVCPFDRVLGATTLAACVGAHVGTLRVSAVGIPSKYRQEQILVDLAADARARRRFIGPLFGELGLTVAVPTLRDRFYFTDAQAARHDVFQVSPVAALLELGLGLELP